MNLCKITCTPPLKTVYCGKKVEPYEGYSKQLKEIALMGGTRTTDLRGFVIFMNELVKLYENPLMVIEQEKLLTFLSKEPPAQWVKKHPFLGHKYLPIDKTEFLLKTIFRRYRIEVLKTGMLLNAVEVTARVHYVDPVTNEWSWHDGVGAWELQTQSKSGPLKLDMSNINSGAVGMALPIAKSLAIKDACDHFGKLFGSDLNRKDTISFEPEKAPDPLNKRLTALIESAKTIEQLEGLRPDMKPELQTLFDEKWNQLNSK